MTIKRMVFKYLDSRRPGRISGWGLFDTIRKRSGRMTYPETLLHYAREYADASGARLDLVDKARSLYDFTPGIKIAEAVR